MRTKIVAGNWKMNTAIKEGVALASDISVKLRTLNLPEDVELIIAPPFTHLTFVEQVVDSDVIKISAQNCAAETKGAYTGEVSAEMLKSISCSAVIIGHSERRAYYHETSEILAEKVNRVLEQKMRPIFCCGEKLEEREAGNHFKIVEKQVSEALFHLSKEEFSQIIIAYEPVWAIGTGVTASKEQAQEIHAFIRKLISEKYGTSIAEDLTILYGGSVKPGNAKEIFSMPDVDGGLIGGAALKADSFIDIINAII